MRLLSWYRDRNLSCVCFLMTILLYSGNVNPLPTPSKLALYSRWYFAAQVQAVSQDHMPSALNDRPVLIVAFRALDKPCLSTWLFTSVMAVNTNWRQSRDWAQQNWSSSILYVRLLFPPRQSVMPEKSVGSRFLFLGSILTMQVPANGVVDFRKLKVLVITRASLIWGQHYLRSHTIYCKERTLYLVHIPTMSTYDLV